MPPLLLPRGAALSLRRGSASGQFWCVYPPHLIPRRHLHLLPPFPTQKAHENHYHSTDNAASHSNTLFTQFHGIGSCRGPWKPAYWKIWPSSASQPLFPLLRGTASATAHFSHSMLFSPRHCIQGVQRGTVKPIYVRGGGWTSRFGRTLAFAIHIPGHGPICLHAPPPTNSRQCSRHHHPPRTCPKGTACMHKYKPREKRNQPRQARGELQHVLAKRSPRRHAKKETPLLPREIESRPGRWQRPILPLNYGSLLTDI